MALPYLRTVKDSINVDKTILPYVYQFYDLPQKALDVVKGQQSLLNFYTSTNPLIFGLGFALSLAPIFLVVSEYHRNYSWVDRFWSLLPTIYNAHYTLYAHLTGVPTGRVDLLLLASTIWSIRLTLNYHRRGGYARGSEDYRWEILQKTIKPRFVWFLFNVTFISTIQMVLLYIVTVPSYVLLLTSKATETPQTVDYIFASLMVLFVATSALSDQQQQDYYNARDKYRKDKTVTKGYTAADLERGFNSTGLFSLSRHPNFASEQSVWITLWFWSATVSDSFTFKNWTLVGPAVYLLLFQSSTMFSENVSRSKYADYKIYQKKVSQFIPLPHGPIDWEAERNILRAKGEYKKDKAL